MIKSINGAGRYVMVNGGFPATTYMNQNSGLMNVGDVRYNIQMQRFEVYDGNMWLEISTSHASIGLTHDAESALDWAIKKKHEEMELEALAKTNPTIADLVNQLKETREKIEVVKLLTKEEQKL